MNEIFEKMAIGYINDVSDACSLMLAGLGLQAKNELIEYRQTAPTGMFYLHGVNKYTFHGQGCRFSNDTLEIDWDFGIGDKWCGLDPWKLAYYIRDNKRADQFHDGNVVKADFVAMVTDEKMIVKLGLYYFV